LELGVPWGYSMLQESRTLMPSIGLARNWWRREVFARRQEREASDSGASPAAGTYPGPSLPDMCASWCPLALPRVEGVVLPEDAVDSPAKPHPCPQPPWPLQVGQGMLLARETSTILLFPPMAEVGLSAPLEETQEANNCQAPRTPQRPQGALGGRGDRDH
jgi:hypothetical protein